MKLITIEGLDGSGKATLTNYMLENMEGTKKIDFPRYDKDTGMLVKRYLNGEFENISPFQAIILYAVDRMISVLEEKWNKHKGIVISDRYTTSNLVFQTARLCKNKQLEDFAKEFNHIVDLIEYLEYEVCKLPKPDIVFFLDVPPKKTELKTAEKDMHEKDIELQQKAREVALALADQKKWIVLNCIKKDGSRKTVKELFEETQKHIKNIEESDLNE